MASAARLGPPGNRGGLHADPVRRGAAAGRGEYRARQQRSSRGPVRRAASRRPGRLPVCGMAGSWPPRARLRDLRPCVPWPFGGSPPGPRGGLNEELQGTGHSGWPQSSPVPPGRANGEGVRAAFRALRGADRRSPAGPAPRPWWTAAAIASSRAASPRALARGRGSLPRPLRRSRRARPPVPRLSPARPGKGSSSLSWTRSGSPERNSGCEIRVVA